MNNTSNIFINTDSAEVFTAEEMNAAYDANCDYVSAPYAVIITECGELAEDGIKCFDTFEAAEAAARDEAESAAEFDITRTCEIYSASGLLKSIDSVAHFFVYKDWHKMDAGETFNYPGDVADYFQTVLGVSSETDVQDIESDLMYMDLSDTKSFHGYEIYYGCVVEETSYQESF